MSKIWLIDAAYLFKAQKALEQGTFHYDYVKLRSFVETEGAVQRAIFLNSEPATAADSQKQFHSWLAKPTPHGPGFEVKLYGMKSKRTKCPDCQTAFTVDVQQGVDIGLATLALTLLDEYDTLILSSGDGDYRDALEHVCMRANKRLELVVFRSGVSPALQQLSSQITWLDDHKEAIRKA
jgi:uncharacterized LabA/DUF88 family protein